MLESFEPKIPAPLIHAIEDAVLLGNIKELDMLLDLMRDDVRVPEEIRYGLEALMYFRLHYGKSGILAPADDDNKQKMLYLESSWGREIIEMIGHYPDLADSRYA